MIWILDWKTEQYKKFLNALLEITRDKNLNFIHLLSVLVGNWPGYWFPSLTFDLLFFSRKPELKRALFATHLCSEMYSFFTLGDIKGYHASENTETASNADCGFVACWSWRCRVPGVNLYDEDLEVVFLVFSNGVMIKGVSLYMPLMSYYKALKQPEVAIDFIKIPSRQVGPLGVERALLSWVYGWGGRREILLQPSPCSVVLSLKGLFKM